MRFCKNPYISRTLGGAMFKLLRYRKDMLSMNPTKFYVDMSISLQDIAIYDEIQNGEHVVHPILAKSVFMDSA